MYLFALRSALAFMLVSLVYFYSRSLVEYSNEQIRWIFFFISLQTTTISDCVSNSPRIATTNKCLNWNIFHENSFFALFSSAELVKWMTKILYVFCPHRISTRIHLRKLFSCIFYFALIQFQSFHQKYSKILWSNFNEKKTVLKNAYST